MQCSMHTAKMALMVALMTAFGADLVCAPRAFASIPGPARLERLHDVLQQGVLPREIPSLEPLQTPEVEQDMAAENTEKLKQTRFVLKSTKILGVSQLDKTEFLPLFETLTGQDVSLKQLFDVVQEMTRMYRERGYILARAILPPQDITAGHVTIQILEGKIDAVKVNGAGADSNLINMWADKLEGRALYNPDLERTLLLMNDLPGVTATSRIEPGDVPGTATLVIETDIDHFSANVALNNYGTRYVGPNQADIRTNYNNAYMDNFGWHDGTQIRGIQTSSINNLSYIDVNHYMPIFNYGTTLELQMHHSRSAPGYTLEELDLESRTSGFAVKLTHPYVRSRQQNLNGYFMLDWRDTTSTSFSDELSSDHIRAMRVGADWNYTDSWNGITSARVEMSQGLGIFGASKESDLNISRAGANGESFTKFKFDLSRLQRLNNSLNILLAATSQYSNQSLLAGDEFGVGGQYFGRGYDNSEIIGDRGIAAKAELQMNFRPNLPAVKSYQLFGFYDFGVTWENNVLSGDSDAPLDLASYGFGIRAQITDRVSADVTLAKPTTSDVLSQGGDDDPRLLINLQSAF